MLNSKARSLAGGLSSLSRTLTSGSGSVVQGRFCALGTGMGESLKRRVNDMTCYCLIFLDCITSCDVATFMEKEPEEET